MSEEEARVLLRRVMAAGWITDEVVSPGEVAEWSRVVADIRAYLATEGDWEGVRRELREQRGIPDTPPTLEP